MNALPADDPLPSNVIAWEPPQPRCCDCVAWVKSDNPNFGTCLKATGEEKSCNSDWDCPDFQRKINARQFVR